MDTFLKMSFFSGFLRVINRSFRHRRRSFMCIWKGDAAVIADALRRDVATASTSPFIYVCVPLIMSP